MRIPAFCCLKGAEGYGGKNGSLLSTERAFIVYLHRKQDFSWFSVQIIITLHALITNDEEELDVMPYIKNPQELTIWSNEYFLQLAERIVWKQE